jgi:hypothetical protein
VRRKKNFVRRHKRVLSLWGSKDGGSWHFSS